MAAAHFETDVLSCAAYADVSIVKTKPLASDSYSRLSGLSACTLIWGFVAGSLLSRDSLWKLLVEYAAPVKLLCMINASSLDENIDL